VGGSAEGLDEFAQALELSRITGVEIPPQILALEGKPPRFDQVCQKDEMSGVVGKFLGL